MRNAARLWTTFAAALVISATASPAAADDPDPYEDGRAQAAQLESAGRVDQAVRLLTAMLPYFPQDIDLRLQLAWMLHHAGRFEEAAQRFSEAIAVSPAAVEPHLGLAHALARLDRCEEARPHYERVAAERPDLGEAAEGLARCAPVPAVRVTASVALGGVYYPDHPEKHLTGSITAGLALAHRSGFYLDAAYRYARFAPPDGAPFSAWDQHEAYGTIGYSGKLGGFLAHYAFVHDGSGSLGNSHHVGFTARFSPYGDIELRGSASFYDDMKELRIEPSWRIPIYGGLSIRPAAGIQDAGGEVFATVMGTLSFDHRRFSLWAGGKYGDEVRPVYFALPVVYDVSEKIAWGAWGGASVNVSDGVRIHLSYAMDRLKLASGAEANAHAMTLGVAVSF
jgi:tetratricopeptide (TPR) repeat protein